MKIKKFASARCRLFDFRISKNTGVSYSRQSESIQVTCIVIFLPLRFYVVLLRAHCTNLLLVDETSYFVEQSHAGKFRRCIFLDYISIQFCFICLLLSSAAFPIEIFAFTFENSELHYHSVSPGFKLWSVRRNGYVEDTYMNASFAKSINSTF